MPSLIEVLSVQLVAPDVLPSSDMRPTGTPKRHLTIPCVLVQAQHAVSDQGAGRAAGGSRILDNFRSKRSDNSGLDNPSRKARFKLRRPSVRALIKVQEGQLDGLAFLTFSDLSNLGSPD